MPVAMDCSRQGRQSAVRLLFSASAVVLKKRPIVGEKDTNRKVVDFTRLLVSVALHLGTCLIVRIDHFGAASSV